MNKFRKGFLLGVSVLTMLFLVACGSSSHKYATYDRAPEANYDMNDYVTYTEEAMENGYYDEEYSYSEQENGSNAQTFNDSARKLIKTYNLSVETEDFDSLLSAVENKIASLNGYVQNLNTYNGSRYSGYKGSRYSNMTVRIPVSNLDKFINFIGETGNITSKDLNVEDVTLQYVDTESRKETYEIEQERLLALLEKCESVEDMIAIESRLSEVRYKLESQESQLRTYDNLVDYATVYLYISEVETYTAPEPVGYWEQVSRSFSDGVNTVWRGLKNFLIGFVGALPVLVLWAVIIVAVVFILKGIFKSTGKKREKKKEKRAEALMNTAINTAKEKAKSNE